MSKLKLDLRVGESVSFDNGRINLVLLEKSGQRARIEINAKEDIKINRESNTTAFSIAAKGINN